MKKNLDYVSCDHIPTLMEQYFKQLNQAVETVLSGVCKRVDVDDKAKVYTCKNIIRIDIKVE